jgi:hypothetical protein
MNDLMEVFAEARFGKRAFLESIFGRPVDPKKRAVRDKIEDLIREERRKREDAKAALEYGKHRIKNPDTGWLGLGWDTLTSLIPAAAFDPPIVKEGQDPADEDIGGRIFDVSHGLAAGTGAGAGALIGRGSLGGLYGAKAMEEGAGGSQAVLTKILEEAGDVDEDVAKALRYATGKGDIALAAQRPGITERVTKYLSPKYWSRRLGAGKGLPTTAAEARKSLGTIAERRLLEAVDPAREAMGEIRRLAREAGKRVGAAGGGKAGAKAVEKSVRSAAKKIGEKWVPEATKVTRLRGIVDDLGRLGTKVNRSVGRRGKIGALIGALALTAPFVASKFIGKRRLRAAGGKQGQAALRKAKQLIEGANKLREERKLLMRRV